MFNLVDTDTQQVKESFTLVIPPRKYKLEEGTRSKITKTFQRVVIDDYGPDNPELTISGYSGTSKAFPTFRAPPLGNDNTEYGSAAAFYTFRNTIMHYRYQDDYEKRQMHVYDLTDEQSYNCFLLKFSLDRSHETPFKYPYSIELFVINRLDDKVSIENSSVLPQGSNNSEATSIEYLNLGIQSGGLMGKAIRSEDFNQGRTDGELEASEDEVVIWDYMQRGGTFSFRAGERVVLNYPQDTFSMSELVNVDRVFEKRRNI